MRNLIKIVESAHHDVRFQYHWSVEPNLVPGKSFAEQHRTVSFDGARGDASGDDAGYIYTTSNLRYWAQQFFYEGTGDFPPYLYLVFVEDGTMGSIDAAHQDANPPASVIVLSKIGEVDMTNDDMPDYGRMEWNAERWLKSHKDEFLRRFYDT